MTQPTPTGMPASYWPLRENDHVRLNGHDAIVIDWAGPDHVIVQVMIQPSDLEWVGRLRAAHHWHPTSESVELTGQIASGEITLGGRTHQIKPSARIWWQASDD